MSHSPPLKLGVSQLDTTRDSDGKWIDTDSDKDDIDSDKDDVDSDKDDVDSDKGDIDPVAKRVFGWVQSHPGRVILVLLVVAVLLFAGVMASSLGHRGINYGAHYASSHGFFSFPTPSSGFSSIFLASPFSFLPSIYIFIAIY